MLDEDLRQACLKALELNRQKVAEYGAHFGWNHATRQFEEVLRRHTMNEQERLATAALG